MPSIQQKLQQAISVHQTGQLAEAQSLYEEILDLQPTDTDAIDLVVVACCNSGYALRAMNRLEQALANYDRALALKGNIAEVHVQRGDTLRALQRGDAALASYHRAIELDPDCAEARLGCAELLRQTGRREAALRHYDDVIGLVADEASLYLDRGNLLTAMQRFDNALTDYDRALALKADYAEAHLHRGIALTALRRPGEALLCFERAIDARPDYAEAHSNRGIALADLRRFDEALASYEKAIALKPDYAEGHANRGIVLTELQRFDEALTSFDHAIALRPSYAQGRFNRSMLLLLLGRFEHGWVDYEWRQGVRESPSAGHFLAAERGFAQPRWHGHETMAGKTVLLYGEQGHGDTLQFCRYARRVAALGARVLLEVQRPLVDLLKCLPGIAQVIARGAHLPAFDFQCPLMSLPHAFGTRLHDIPCAPRYLDSDAQKRAHWEARLGNAGQSRVGLVWRGNPGHRNDQFRSVPLRTLLTHLPPGFHYVSLQKDPPPQDRGALEDSHLGIWDVTGDLDDFSDTAALCDCLDLIISVDTGVAHLSAALGKKTWIVLPLVPDWRWLLGRDDSPWYPSVRLYRSPSRGDWSVPLRRLGADLRKGLR